MEIEEIIAVIDENIDIREEIIYWLNDNGYLDDFKIYAGGNDDY
jgi:hypothetical protein